MPRSRGTSGKIITGEHPPRIASHLWSCHVTDAIFAPSRAVDQMFALASGDFPRIMSEAFSATMIVGAFVLHDGTKGITDASTTRSPSIPRSLRSGVTTVPGPVPMAQVPAG